jgi:hypothetical protein
MSVNDLAIALKSMGKYEAIIDDINDIPLLMWTLVTLQNEYGSVAIPRSDDNEKIQSLVTILEVSLCLFIVFARD